MSNQEKTRNAIDGYFDALYQRAPRTFDVNRVLTGGEPLQMWKGQLRAAFLKTLGTFPDPVPLSRRDIETVKRPGYMRIKLTYTSEADLETVTYLLIPDGVAAPAPAVVACTGHGYGVRDIVGLTEDFKERDNLPPTYQKDFAVELARRGFVVIAPEPLAFGEMRLADDIKNHRHSSCDRASVNLIALGRTLAGVRVQQYIAAVTLLAQMPEVDENRIGAMGISGGGLTSSFLAMLDPRIKAVVPSGYACMYKDSIYAMPHCVDNFPFGLMNVAENCDLMSLIAPRPMLWESGSKDPIFPRAGVEEAEAIVRGVYAHCGAEDKFEVDYFEGEHEISGRMAYDFLLKHL